VSRRRGFSIVEISVGMFVGGLVLLVIYQLFALFRRGAEAPMASLDMEGSTLAVTRWLQRDLAETNLQSIRSNSASGTLAFESPRDLNGHLCINDLGTVEWKKFAFYSLQPVSGSSDRYQLVYDESTAGVQVEPGAPPAPPSSPSPRYRVLGTSFVRPADGGLRVFWTDASGSEHDFGDAASQRGEPARVSLVLQTTSGATGNQTKRVVAFDVKPQN
jgi:Prokaryotic N-terminal methylation motif